MRSDEAIARCVGRHTVPVAKALHLSVSTVGKWKEPTLDFSDSGALNPIDRIETMVKTAISEGQPLEDALAPILCLAAKFSMTAIPIPKITPAFKDIVKQSHRSIQEFGEFISAFSAAIADGEISPVEHGRVDKEALELIQQVVALMQLLDCDEYGAKAGTKA